MNLFDLAYKGVSPKRGNDNLFDTMVQRYVDAGYPEAAAYGMMAGKYSESGLNPTINERAPVIPGSRGGYGSAQWTGPRRVSLEAYAADRGGDLGDILLQQDFELLELETTERRARDALMRASSPEEAAMAYTKYFLRPGIDHSKRSAAMARRFAAGERPSNAFMSRQLNEVSDIQNDIRNQVEELNKFENDAATLYANPAEMQKFAAMQPFQPMGGPSIMGTAHDNVLLGGIGDDLDLGESADASFTSIPLPQAGSLSYGLGATPPVGPTGAPTQAYTFSPERGDVATEQEASPLAPLSSRSPQARPEPEQKSKWWRYSPEQIFSGLEALGIGLGQISANQPVNVTGAFQRRTENDLAKQQMGLQQAQEARLSQTHATTLQKMAAAEEGRRSLAADYFQRTGDESGALAIMRSEDAAAQYAQARFPEPSSKSGKVTDRQLDVASYESQEARDGLAAAAAEVGYPPAVVEQIRARPEFAATAAPQVVQLTANQRNLANSVSGDALVDLLTREYDEADTPEDKQYYKGKLSEARLATAGHQPDQASIDAIFKDVRKRSQKGGEEAAKLSAQQEIEQRANESTAEYIRGYGEEYTDLANMARNNPKEALVELDKRREAARELAETVTTQGANEGLAQLFDEAAQEHPDDSQSYRVMAAAARAGDIKKAMDVYDTLTEKPNEQKMLELFQGSPDALEMAKELRRSQTGRDRESINTELQAAALGRDQEKLAQADRILEAIDRIEPIVFDPSFTSGPLNAWLMPALGAMQELGINTWFNENINEMQLVDAVSSGLVQFQRAPGVGQMSDYDAKTLKASIMAMDKTPDANRAMVQWMRHSAESTKASVAADLAYFTEGNDMNDYEARTAFKKQYMEKLGIRESPFYALGNAGGVYGANQPKAAPLAVASALQAAGKLRDGDMVYLNGKIIQFNQSLIDDLTAARQ